MLFRRLVQAALDFLIDTPQAMYLIAVGLSGLFLLVPRGYTSAFIDASLPTMSSTAFALFGFMATALSILTTLKTTPFFETLQEVRAAPNQNRSTWRDLVGAFLHLMGIFATLGVFSFSITKDRVAGLAQEYYNIISFLYIGMVLTAFCATIAAIYLLRLVANAPLPKKKVVDNVSAPSTSITSNQDIVDL